MVSGSRCLKMAASLLGAAASVIAVLGLFGSCNNPFVSDLGEQVVIGRPTVTINYPPPNAILTGEVRFSGDAWAHRELRRIEVRIGNNTTGERFGEPGNPIRDWTDITNSVYFSGGALGYDRDPIEGVDGTWSFYLSTLGLGMADGTSRMRFRVFDNTEDPVYSAEIIYRVKNLPSTVRMTFPTDMDIAEAGAGDALPVMSGALVQGRINDARGLEPGYPMIQIWPADRADITADPDAFSGDDRFGWASMFLVDPIADINDDADEGRYDLRHDVIDGEYVARTVNVASFGFRLSSFTIEPRGDGVRAAVFGDPLEMGEYYFRIITRDTRGIVGHFPPLNHGGDHPNPFSPGRPVRIDLMKNVSPPSIELSPGDQPGGPSLYVTTGINERKVSVDDPDGPPRPSFRLQVVARHDYGISRAELRWAHPERGSGELDLDADRGGEYGHVPTGTGRNEVHFTFTATRDTRDAQGDLIFVTHPAAYTLTLRVYGRVVGAYADRTFTLVMDGAGPTVSMRPSVRGAYASADGDAVAMRGGLINVNYIIVNGNIQVSVDHSASSGIMNHGGGRGVPPPNPGHQMVKWFAEPAFDLDDPVESGTVLYDLMAFQRDPSRASLGFFFYPASTRTSGWVSPPASGPHPAYGTHNFKVDTTGWGDDAPEYKWLYVIAMDGLYNLGFAMQKILVDQSTDIPNIDVAGFDPDLGPGYDLKVAFEGTDPRSPGFIPRPNILHGEMGIYINLSDDDGITRNADDIIITLYRLNDDFSDRYSGTLDTAQLRQTLATPGGMLSDNSARSWFGGLDRATMATVFGLDTLPAGTYRLRIRVYDDPMFKVQIDGVAPGRRHGDEYFYFAVHTDAPVVVVESHDDMDPEGRVYIYLYGTVEFPGPWALGSLWITLCRHVSAGFDLPDSYHHHRISIGNGLTPTDREGIYEWEKRVNFAPDVPGLPQDGTRTFTVTAFDNKGFYSRVARRVAVDTVPPEIRFTGFNQGRPLSPASEGDSGMVFEVWGNVHFEVTVSDAEGIRTSATPEAALTDMDSDDRARFAHLADVRWWLLPHDAPSPEWHDPFPTGADGTGGHFFAGDPNLPSSMAFQAVFDSYPLAPGYFKLYVIAYDNNGNRSSAERMGGTGGNAINKIRVNQYADRPELVSHYPRVADGNVPVRRGSVVRGLANDTDGFRDVPDPGSHVEIRFAQGENGPWSGWQSASGEFDGVGAMINFDFDVMTLPGFGDGLIRYQIRITDHADGLTNRARSKNPQLDPNDAPIHTFFTGDPAYPLPNIRRVGTRSYIWDDRFILDTTDPVIGLADDGAMLGDSDGLLGYLPGGTVTDANLYSLYVSFGPHTFPLLSRPDPATDDIHNWNWDFPVEDGTTTVRDKLVAWFDGAFQGPHTITFTALDLAGNRSLPSPWSFTKDTQGPGLTLLGMQRSIYHYNLFRGEPIVYGDFPPDWPLDWPHGPRWVYDWCDYFQYTIANWPSDFAFLPGDTPSERITETVARINAERALIPFVLVDYRTIRGRFDDRFSPVWDAAGNATMHYRFGNGQRDADATTWRTLELTRGDAPERTAEWSINLDELPDGDNTFDIMFSDVAGNMTEVFGIRFVKDNADPFFFAGDDPRAPDVQGDPDLFTLILGPGLPTTETTTDRIFDGMLDSGLEEALRVFSAEGAASYGDGLVFRLRGRLHDYTLRDLVATVSSNLRTIEARVVTADAPENGGNYSTDLDNNMTCSLQRLNIRQLDENGEWEWTLGIRERDVVALGDGGVNIRLDATDAADRAARVEWRFFLDSVQPRIAFEQDRVINPGDAGTYAVTLNGSADDPIAGIAELRLAVGRYTHDETGGDIWTWIYGDPANPSEWLDVLPTTGDRAWVSWTRSMAGIVSAEGRYRLAVFARDRSLHWLHGIGGIDRDGNPINTNLPIGGDAPTAPSAQDRVTGDAVFFVDRGGPSITRIAAWEPQDQGDHERVFFNTNPSDRNLRFGFTMQDLNTIPDVPDTSEGAEPGATRTNLRAQIRNAAGTYPPLIRDIPIFHFDGLERVPGPSGNPWDTGPRTFFLEPDMADLPGNAEYTLFLIVQDGAGIEISYSRRFNLANQGPDIQVRTVNMLADTDTTRHAFIGPVAVRGSTELGGSQIANVSYALIPHEDHGSTMNDAFFRGIDTWRDEGYSWLPTNPAIPNDSNVRLEEGAGVTWTVSIPNTRNIRPVAGSDIARYVSPLRPRPRPSDYDWHWSGGVIDGDGSAHYLNQVRLALRVEDMAGNVNFTYRDLWIYPFGDRPLVEITTPGDEALMGGTFRISGLASDNERVRNVFFRVLCGGDPVPLSIPHFEPLPGGTTVPDGYQAPSSFGYNDFEHYLGGYWYRASSSQLGSTDWWAPINAYGELDPPARGERRRITIQVIAKDAAYMGAAQWNDLNPVISDLGTLSFYVVSGAPMFAGEEILRLARYGTNWVPGDEWGLPASGPGNWRNPMEVHMGGSGRAIFRFRIRHETALNEIMFRGVNLLDLAPGSYNNADYLYGLNRTDIPTGTAAIGPEFGPGIVARVDRHTGALTADGFRVYTVYVQVNTNLLNGGGFRGNAGWFNLDITAADGTQPSPNRITQTLRLPIDNSPPTALYELTARPAGSAATLGGSAGAGPTGVGGTVGGVDRVVVWFQRGADGVSWWRDAAGFPGGTNDFAPGEVISVYRPIATSAGQPVGWGTVRLPSIPAATAAAGGYSAIVIDRNDPLGSAPRFGNSFQPQAGGARRNVATGWTPGGAGVGGQNWNFTIDSTGLPSGPIDMHYVVFDRAGNASHHVQPLIIMNNAPQIGRIQFATDIRGDNPLGAGTENEADITGIFSRIRDHHVDFIPGAIDTEERDIRSGITPLITPATHVLGSAITGARHDIHNFTVRNNLLALRVETLQPPAEGLHDEGRTFRVEYVSSATRLAGSAIQGRMMEGRAFIIQEPGQVPWRALGASAENPPAGYAFLAVAPGDDPGIDWDGAVAYELNPSDEIPEPLEIDYVYFDVADRLDATQAEFAYRSGAFGSGGIIDHTGNPSHPWHQRYSLFIVRVFDGPEEDVFTDFTLLSLRVNNNDITAPFAQLYDLNPMAENLGSAATPPEELAPLAIGQNRIRGGLWRDDDLGNLSRPGHIEPRRITALAGFHTGGYAGHEHSLTPTQMGRDPSAPSWETVNSAAFFAYDTVSGRVVLRGYAEDDQRLGGVVLEFTGPAPGTSLLGRIPILRSRSTIGAPVLGTATVPASTGLLESAQGDNVLFTDSIDLYRHRVEWAFVWDTALFPANTVVGNITVRAIAVNATTPLDNILSGALPTNTSISPAEAVGRTAAAVRGAGVMGRSHVGMLNYGFPAALQMYNQIRVNIRPYITGFRRDANEGFNNTRSLQGRFPFSRGETVVVTGFNLGGTGTTTVSLPGAAGITTHAPASGYQGRFGLSSLSASLYRGFQIPAGAVTGNGLVTLNVGGFYAANTSSERTPLHVQPWNAERSLAVGSDLWDNITRVHIWQSDSAVAGENQGSFPTSQAGAPVFGASMSINPLTGVLHASHNEGGPGNTGITFRSANQAVGATTGLPAIASRGTAEVSRFPDPIINSSVFISPRGYSWTVYSSIGRAGAYNVWDAFGGVWIHGPGGGSLPHGRGSSNYMVESTWYNGSVQNSAGWSVDSWGSANGIVGSPALTQFRSPRIVTHWDGTNEHIHVVYFDEKDGSIKYRYNRRGTYHGMGSPAEAAANNIPRGWTNLDGGFDADDWVRLATTPTGTTAATPFTFVGDGDRIANFAGRRTSPEDPRPNPATRINAGLHNDIAVTSHGHPVVVYYDATNQRLRMAISNSLAPYRGDAWVIIEDVARGLPGSHGAGQYVSIRIDTRPSGHMGGSSVQDTVHIATFNSVTNSLVYISGVVNSVARTWDANPVVQVVGSVGNVGRRSAISLDEEGRPWIAFLDTRNLRGMDGVKVAFRDTVLFGRGQQDMHGNSIMGWETMHVPARFIVRDEQNFRFSSQLGMENFPTRNVTHSGGDAGRRFWGAAVGFMSDDLFRIAYWVR